MTTTFSVSVKGNAVWIEPDGGNVRCRNNRQVQWTNKTKRPLELTFSEWLEDNHAGSASVWPFSAPAPGRAVTIPDGGTWIGTLAGTGQNIVKYTATVLDTSGQPDEKFRPLDPIIIVER